MEKRKLELEASDVVEAHDSATVHGIVVEVSPVKSGKRHHATNISPVNFPMEKIQGDW